MPQDSSTASNEATHGDKFPFASPPNPLKRQIKAGLGRLLASLLPARAERLLAEGDPQSFGLLDRTILNGLAARARRSGDPAALKKLQAVHRRFWQGAGARITHNRNREGVLEWFALGDEFALKQLEALLATGRYHTLCEIGCGAGKLLEFLQQALPAPLQLIGIDLSAEQIASNRARGLAGIRYESGDAVTWLAEHAEPGWILLSNGGVLEYFLDTDLLRMFGHAAGNLAPAAVVLVEPIDPEQDFAREPGSRMFGLEQTFSHHYAELAGKAGLRVIGCHNDVRFSGQRWCLLAAERA